MSSPSCTDRRPYPSDRKFQSVAVDAAISTIASKMKDRTLACIFSNALPNTLDTTVEHFQEGPDGEPDTFIITGDIAAMWLRDSTNQVLPYLRFVKDDKHLANMIKGLVRRQTAQILVDVYANAHNIDASTGNTPHSDDATTRPTIMNTSVSAMQPLIFERKYELDSLGAFLKLSRKFHEALPNDTSPFDSKWINAVKAIIKAMRGMQTSTENDPGIYRFQRNTMAPTDTLWQGTGFPGAFTGMIRSGFRPSDDSCTYPFLIPANAMAVVELRKTADLLRILGNAVLAAEASELAASIDAGIKKYALRSSDGAYAYEVDGYSNMLFMDDANVPSLLSLPYLGYTSNDSPAYKATRAYILNGSQNPFFFNGTAGEGIGSPHTGLGNIWHMAVTMQALTSSDTAEVRRCLSILRDTAEEASSTNLFIRMIRPSFRANGLVGQTHSLAN